MRRFKWFVMLCVVLALLCAYFVINLALESPLSPSASASPAATPAPSPFLGAGARICRGTVVSIDINAEAIRDKLRNHNRLWIVTVQPDPDASNAVPPPKMQFMMHSPSQCGFRNVGDHVDVFNGAVDIQAIPAPP